MANTRAARSLKEGAEETLTLQRLNVPLGLLKTGISRCSQGCFLSVYESAKLLKILLASFRAEERSLCIPVKAPVHAPSCFCDCPHGLLEPIIRHPVYKRRPVFLAPKNAMPH